MPAYAFQFRFLVIRHASLTMPGMDYGFEIGPSSAEPRRRESLAKDKAARFRARRRRARWPLLRHYRRRARRYRGFPAGFSRCAEAGDDDDIEPPCAGAPSQSCSISRRAAFGHAAAELR